MNKRDRIIQAAANCFLERGFAEVSLDDIANHADVVKQTIYNYFGDKEALFNQAVDYLLKGHVVELPKDWYRLEPEAFFLNLAKLQCKTLIEPGVTDFLRLLVKECRRFPELQVLYAQSIPTPMIEFIAGYLLNSDNVCQTIRQDEKLSFAIAWSFRAAIAGFATLINLGPLISETMPTKSRYLQVLSRSFAALVNAEHANLVAKSDAQNHFANQDNGENDKDSFKRFLGVVRRQKQGEKKLEILFGALRTFSEHGFAEASMDQVATLSSGSKQTIYKHFGSKRLLFTSLFESIIEQLETVSFPEDAELKPTYLPSYSATLFAATGRQWMREYFRLVFGESQSFARESGRLLAYLMEHGRAQLAAFMKKHLQAESDVLCKSIEVRCILGSFVLLRQVYVLGETPFIDEGRLIKVLEGLMAN